MKEENCGCNNKGRIYACVDTPQGTKCTPIDKVPQCFDRKVTFVKFD